MLWSARCSSGQQPSSRATNDGLLLLPPADNGGQALAHGLALAELLESLVDRRLDTVGQPVLDK